MRKWIGWKSMRRKLCAAALLAGFVTGGGGSAQGAEKIIFIAHDNRPISMQQTAEVAEQAGYELVIPPEDILSRGLEEPGDPEKLWAWLKEHAGSARAAVVSTDAMLYGGLIPSRKHEIPGEILHQRLGEFRKLHAAHPRLSLYLFGSLMRTPKSGLYSGNEEPGYYSDCGEDIFRYTALTDKEELSPLSAGERKEMEEAHRRIPSEVLEDWMNRRKKNFSATVELMDMVKEEVARCFIVGRDDNAPLCQTHKENRELLAHAGRMGLSGSQFRTMSGIDEFNLLLLTRAANDLNSEIPFIHVIYNEGKGQETVPSYSDEHIGISIRDSVALVGGMMVPQPEKADFVLLVNTDPKGESGEAGNIDSSALSNSGKQRRGTKHFFQLVKDCVDKGYPVGIADVVFANGSDNTLMHALQRENLLGKLRAYSGWNTATNSSGFALGTGILSSRMTEAGRKRLLTRRYLDDWAYQANVRTALLGQLWAEGRGETYSRLDNARAEMEERTALLLRDFARKNLSSFEGAENVSAQFPWNRMFEVKLIF